MAKCPDIIIEFLNFVEEAYADWPDESRQFFFRGQADCSWALLPSVARQNSAGHHYDERQLILDYKQVAAGNTYYRSKTEGMLVEMHHFSIPTRLLEWSQMPEAALYFACLQQDMLPGCESDGIVYIMNPWEPYRQILRGIRPHPELADILKEARMLMAQGWSFDDIYSYIKANYRYGIVPEALRAPLPFVGRYMVNGLASPKSGYVIWGDVDNPSYVEHKFRDIREFKEYKVLNVLKEFVIPCESKKIVLDFLRRHGINHFTLAPDGYGISRDVRNIGGIFKTKW